MPGPGNVLIKIGADAGQAVSELGGLNKSLGQTMTTSEKMGAGLRKAALPAAAALGVVAVAGKKAADDASGLQESVNAVTVVFGDASKTITHFSTKAAKEAGLSMRDLNELVTPLGASFINMGDSQEEAAKKSIVLAKRAADLASVFNVDVKDALGAMQAGLRGEADPLEKFGVGLSDAAVTTKAMSLGLAATEKQLTAADKAQARYALLLQQTNRVQGDFAKTSDSAANASRINAAEQENLSASLGKALLPAMELYQKALGLVIGFTSEHQTATKVLTGIIVALAAGVLVANAAMKLHAVYLFAAEHASKVAAAASKAYAAAQWLVNAALSANPIGLVVIALAALAAGIYLAYTRSQTFRNIVDSAMDAVASSIRAVDRAFDALKASAFIAWDWVTSHWKLALFAFGPIGAAVYLISENFDRIKRMASAAFQAILDGINKILGPIRDLIDLIGRIKFPKKPKWIPFSLPTAMAPMPGALGFAAAPAGAAGRSGSSAAPITVNVYGAVDPEGTARAIRRILTSHDRRQGRSL